MAVVTQVAERRLRQSEAAVRLGLSVRQVKRLVRRCRERGAAGLASGHRGKRSNNAIDASARREVMELVRERYRDFGPTFAREKLVEEHGHRLSSETLRKWMIEDGLRRAKPRREHPSRPRRECLGDLVRIDGSPHDWFEGKRLQTGTVRACGADRRLAARLVRGPGSSAHADSVRGRRDVAAVGGGLLPRRDDRGVHEDDARPLRGPRAAGGVLLGSLRGVPGEPSGPGGRADAVRPCAAHAGCRVDPRGQSAGEGPSGAGQPDAPGPAGEGDAAARDRRHDAGNTYLPMFMADFNRRFRVEPRNPADAHRAVSRDERERRSGCSPRARSRHRRRTAKTVRLHVDRMKEEQRTHQDGGAPEAAPKGTFLLCSYTARARGA